MLQPFMGSFLAYSNTAVAGFNCTVITRQMYEMSRQLMPGALNIIRPIRRTIATMTRGTKCYILLLQCLHTTFLMIAGPISPPKYGFLD